MDELDRACGSEARERQVELAKLIALASQQPGVQQLMAVYQSWKPLEPLASGRRSVGVQRVVTVSNSSAGDVLGSS